MQFYPVWRLVYKWILYFFPILLICFGTPALTRAEAQQDFLPLMESIQFEKDIQFCGITIPVKDPQVRERLEKEMLLALWNRPQVILWIKRSTRFFPHVEKILKQHGLPLDLKYVPVIESALRPHASSSKGAVGYWQFLKFTGRRYGLRIDSYVDERRNIFKSTHAACQYLKDLENQFGSYLLALSAYNMGEYGLNHEIEAQQNRDFFSLYLPLQTQQYAFKIICAKLILENQTAYGFSLKESDVYPVFSFDTVSFKSEFPVPIAVIAQAADIPFKTIKDFNPEIRGYHFEKGNSTLLIPTGKAKGFKKNFNAHYKDWKKTYKTKFHIVESGESLIGIAQKYEMPLLSLLRLNNLSVKSMIHPGDRLLIE